MIHHRQHGSISVVLIDRPERRNALDHEALDGLAQALDAIEVGVDRAVVLAGAGGNFCSGGDISGVEDPAFVARLGRVLERLRDLSMPTIAAVDGFALGAGTQLALACDLRLATPGARVGIPAAKLGLMVDWWTVERVASMAGQGTARSLFLAAEQLTGDRAYALGLVQRLAVGGPVLDEALTWAAEIATLAPLTVQGLKAGLNAAERIGAGPPVGYQEAFDRAWSSADLQEGLAAFAARRPPAFQGR